MAVTSQELDELAEGLERNNAREMIVAAAALHLVSALLSHYGTANRKSLQPQIAMLQEMAAAWLRDGGRDPAELASAAAALRRAGETAQMLDRIPA